MDKRKDKKIQGKIAELEKEFRSLSEEDQKREDIKENFRKRKKEIQKKKSSTGLGCLLIVLRLFILLAVVPVINYFDYYVNPLPGAHNFLGFDLTADGPGYTLTWALIFPIFATLPLLISGFLSIRKNLKAQEKADEIKSEEEKREEERLLKEMGIKKNKFPVGYIVQIVFSVLYFHTFSHIKLALSLYWGVYYMLGFVIRRIVEFEFAKDT